jgi:hypothetical protein
LPRLTDGLPVTTPANVVISFSQVGATPMHSAVERRRPQSMGRQIPRARAVLAPFLSGFPAKTITRRRAAAVGGGGAPEEDTTMGQRCIAGQP